MNEVLTVSRVLTLVCLLRQTEAAAREKQAFRYLRDVMHQQTAGYMLSANDLRDLHPHSQKWVNTHPFHALPDDLQMSLIEIIRGRYYDTSLETSHLLDSWKGISPEMDYVVSLAIQVWQGDVSADYIEDYLSSCPGYALF